MSDKAKRRREKESVTCESADNNTRTTTERLFDTKGVLAHIFEVPVCVCVCVCVCVMCMIEVGGTI
jgi:hypothetical protein